MHVLALDLGTSGAKAALIDLRTGETTAACSQPHPTHTLPGGGVEQSPEDWLAAARVAVAALPTDDVAALIRFLCSDEAGYITGEIIGVDGGMMKVQNPYRAYEYQAQKQEP